MGELLIMLSACKLALLIGLVASRFGAGRIEGGRFIPRKETPTEEARRLRKRLGSLKLGKKKAAADKNTERRQARLDCLNISASDQTQFAKSSEALAGQYEAEIRRTRQKIRQSRGSQGSQQP